MKTYRTKLKAGIAIWCNELNQKQASLPDELQKINPNFQITASTLSKAKTGNDTTSEGKLIQIVKILDELLQSYGYAYNEDLEKYIVADADKAKERKPLPKPNPAEPLVALAGIYESYHIGKHGHNILKNIVYIYPNGEVKMHGIDNNQYFGQANIFQSSLLAINFHQANDYPFYIQILFHIGNYGKLASKEVKHLFGICSSVSIDNEPIAYKRVLIRISDLDEVQDLHPQSINLDSEAFHQLNQAYPNLGNFLKESGMMISNYKVNDEFVRYDV